MNRVNAVQFQLTGTEHRISTAYYPQTEGLVERYNQTLQRSLRIKDIYIYNACLMPDTYREMVQCDICHKWFHIKCVGILTLPNTDDKLCCSSCVCD